MISSRVLSFHSSFSKVRARRCAYAQPLHSFYNTHTLGKFDNKNVVYLAYVGRYNDLDIFKYGKSSNVYQREMTSHRKHFDTFEMYNIYLTNHKDHVETQLEKELKLRNMHLELVINNKKQTELFCTTPAFDIHAVDRIVRDIIQEFALSEAETRALEIEKIRLEREIIKLQRAQVNLEILKLKQKNV
jgi:hypothetical protein